MGGHQLPKYGRGASQRSDYVELLNVIQRRLQELFNVDGKTRKLRIENIDVGNVNVGMALEEQLDAKYYNRDFTNPVRADFVLYDNDGKEIERLNQRLVMHLPALTERGTFIMGGKEYSVKRQLRLKPGIYTTEVSDGVQAFINTSTRQNMKVKFNPDTSMFSLHVGARKFPLMAVLEMLGVPREQFVKMWGQDIVDDNHASDKTKATVLNNLYATMFSYAPQGVPAEEKIANLKEALSQSSVDPWVTKVTVGREAESLSPELLFQVSKKMLDVSAGRAKPDRRDALYFKVPLGIDDMVDIAIGKQSNNISKKVRLRLDDPNRAIESIVSRPLVTLGGTVRMKFLLDELSSTPEQVNPFDIWSARREFTVMGEGGIPSTHSVSPETQGIDDTYLGFIDPIQSPTGGRVGLNMFMARAADKDGKRLVARGREAQTGKPVSFSPEEAYDKVVALPGSFELKDGRMIPKSLVVKALVRGEIKEVPAKSVDWTYETPEATINQVINVLPFLNHNSPVRANYTGNQMKQALPLKYREAPLVKSFIGRMDNKDQYGEDDMYELTNLRVPSHLDGAKVVSVGSDYINVLTSDGKKANLRFYNAFPLNGTTFLDYKPTVKPGDVLRDGAIYAENNFSKDGQLAFGVNLRVGYLPYKGLNFMDGLVVSESAAKKLTSEHIHQMQHGVARSDILSKKRFVAHYPGSYNAAQLANLDDDGVVREGAIVEPGDPLMLKMGERALTEDDILRGNISSVFKNPLTRNDHAWDRDVPGRVVKVVRGDDFVKVWVRTEEPLVVGDKASTRAGAKGVVVAIIPDDQMPHDASGRPLDVIQNPAAVPSRMNISQILETAAGKVAEYDGKPFNAPNLHSKIDASVLKEELRKRGLSDTEMLYDENNKPIGQIYVGPQYFTKQKQQSFKALRARSREDPYELASRRPHKGPKQDLLGLFSMLSHGASNVLKETATFKSEWNDDYWRALEMGQPVPAPKTTFAYNQLINMLKGAGINIREEGPDLRLVPLTDRDVLKMSGGEVPDPGRVVRIGEPGSHEFLAPQPGGLYDRQIFGGMSGTKWGHISLADGFPNPMYEDAIRSLLDLSKQQFMGLVSGRLGIDSEDNIKPYGPGVMIGGNAMARLLSKIDRDDTIKQLVPQTKTLRGASRDKAVKKLKFLAGLKRAGMQPTDYMMSKLPVLPPAYRPVYMTKDDKLRVSDLTVFYQNIGRINNSLKDMRGLPRRWMYSLREDAYKAIGQLQGVEKGDASQARMAKGILEYLKGDTPRTGYFQSKMLAKRQALGGRAVIMGDPKLDMDEIRLPEEIAWTIYRPFIIKRLVQNGMPALRAKTLTDNRSKVAEDALDQEMAERPLILSRDPKLHKYNYLAFNAKKYPGTAIYLPPLVTKGFNADFDGDQMSVTVPVTPAAVHEAKTKMRPSQNVIKYGPDSVLVKPEEDTIAGLYRASMAGDARPSKRYNNFSDALEAFRADEIGLTDMVAVGNQITSPARIMINEKLPEGFRNYDTVWSDKALVATLNRIADESPQDYKATVQGLKDLGDMLSYKTAISYKLDDFIPIKNKTEINSLPTMGQPPANFNEIRERVINKLKEVTDPKSAMAVLADSGAKGSWSNVLQILYSPIYSTGFQGKAYPQLLRTGYGEGMDFPDYWTAAKGSRVSEMGKAIEVRDPGYFGKQLTRAALGVTVRPGKPAVVSGIDYEVSHPTVLYRYLAKDAIAPNGMVIGRAGQPVTQDMVVAAQKAGLKQFNVRSPLTTSAPEGLYAEDFGRLPGADKPAVGTNMGAISAQTLSEPATQLVLKSFHQAGAAGASKKIEGLYMIWPLLNGRAPAGQKAAMAPRDGVIKSINTLKSGTRILTMDNGQEIVASPGLDLYVKAGDAVKRGQQLQDGYMDPQEMLKYRGLRELQRYLVEQISTAYGKTAPDNRYIEVLVGALTRFAKIEDPGDADDFVYGDVVAANKLAAMNNQLKAAGMKPIVYKPVFAGMDQHLQQLEPDWAMKMLGGDLVRQMRRAAATGATSSRRGANPIMPFLYGINFGDTLEETGEY